jgi:type IV secretory pathway VirJ component
MKFRTAVLMLASLGCIAPVQAASAAEGIDDLPVVALPPAKAGGDRMAILVSGDGGWAGLAKTIAAALAADGIGVAGLDSLKYFWQAREPDEVTRDVQRIAEHYGREWRASQVIFIGYSFGADVLPLVLNRLPRGLTPRPAGLTLIAPSSTANFEIKVTGWLGASHPGPPTLPELERLRGLPMVCLYGADDEASVCPELPKGLARVEELPGGHHFGGNYDAVARSVLPAP